ncbi:MAG: hypothetical protein WCX84_04655 [Syntrophales bacterium]|jgi:hypothetical protein|nr:hypothetical protein [Syntrophales bacterium]
MKIKDIYEIIHSNDLFRNLGVSSFLLIDGFEQVVSEQEAFLLWEQKEFTEARIVAWEALRTKIITDSSAVALWKKEFAVTTETVFKAIQQVVGLDILLDRYSLSIVDFARDLPFVGAIGECIAFGDNSQKMFFRCQMEVFAKGHWVCGWQGEPLLNKGIYPEYHFKFY